MLSPSPRFALRPSKAVQPAIFAVVPSSPSHSSRLDILLLLLLLLLPGTAAKQRDLPLPPLWPRRTHRPRRNRTLASGPSSPSLPPSVSIRAHPRPILSCPQRQPPALRHEPGFPDEPSVRDNRIIVQEHLKPTACDEPMLRNGARRQCRVIARADGAVAFQDSQELNDPHIRVRRPASLSLGAVLSCMLAGLHRPRMKSSEPCGRSTSASSRGRPRPGGRAGVSRPFVPGRLRDMDGACARARSGCDNPPSGHHRHGPKRRLTSRHFWSLLVRRLHHA